MYKERIANLMQAVNNGQYAQDDLEFIETRMNAFTDYMNHVAWMETHMQRLNVEGVKGEEWRHQVEQMDKNRRSKHNVAIDAINQLNRMSKANGLELFYDGPTDEEHRTEVGDLIGNIVNEYFKGRTVGQLKQTDLMGTVDTDLIGDADIDEPSFIKAVESIPETTTAQTI